MMKYSDKMMRYIEVVRNALFDLPDGTLVDAYDVCDYVQKYMDKNPRYKKSVKRDITPVNVAKYIKGTGLVDVEPIVPGGQKSREYKRKVYEIHHQEPETNDNIESISS